MKKILFVAFAAAIVAMPSMADGIVTETETVTTVEVLDYNYTAPRYVSSAQVMPCKRPYAKRASAPVRVKTHTEVIDHYQLYQPVTIYKPVGKKIEKHIIPAKPCGKCAF